MRRINEQDTLDHRPAQSPPRSARTRPPKRLAKLERRQQRVTAIVLAGRNEVANIKVRLHRHDASPKRVTLDGGQGRSSARARGPPDGAGEGAGQDPGAPRARRRADPRKGRFIWPVNGTISGSFGRTRGRTCTRDRHRRALRDARPRRQRRHGADRQRLRAATATTPASATAAGCPPATRTSRYRRERRAEREPGPGHRRRRLHRALDRAAPALRGAHQRVAGRPAGLPLTRPTTPPLASGARAA